MHSRTPPKALAIEFLGNSDAFLSCGELLARLARVERPVLLVGERGTGKELAAARLHYLSQRWQGPFVALNCAALQPNLLESELFGHEVGAFTGAVARRSGCFEAADRGTLFLDELAAMPLRAQEKVLRVLEYGEFQPLGGRRTLQVDVRVVGASNADLPALSRKGRFKPDLLDRLSFGVLTLPPLRERGDDVLLLAEHFASGMALELGVTELPRFGPRALAQLHSHPWPGNVRELKNTVERAVFKALGGVVEVLELDPFASPWRPGGSQEEAGSEPGAQTTEQRREALRLPLDLPSQVRELERAALEQALHQARHNQREAAALLGLRYHQFRALYRKHGQGRT